MLTKKTGRFSAIQKLLFVCFLINAMVCASLASSKEMTVKEMYSAGLDAMQSQDYEDATGYFYGFIDAVKDSENPDIVVRAQDVRYKLSLILIKALDRKDEAIDVLKDYVSKDFALQKRTALKMLAACYFETEMYEECIETVKEAIEYDKTPVVAATPTTAKKKSDEEEEEEDIFADEEGPEVPYTQEDLLEMNFTMAEAYFKLEKMEECLEPYAYISENTKDEQRKGYAIMQSINALVALEKFDRILAWIPELYKTPARYDIRVNLALFQAAAVLVDVQEYDSALPLFRMILPRDELIAYQNKKIRKMRIDAGLPPEMGQTMTEDEQLLFGREETPSGEEMDALAAAEEEKKPKELKDLEVLLEALNKMAPYENFVNFQMARVYKEVDRYWEGVKFFDMVAASDPTGELGLRSVYESVALLGNDLNNREEADARALPFLDHFNTGQYPRIVTYILTSVYQKQKDWKAVGGLRKYIDGFVRENDLQIIKYDTELYFMQGVANLMLQNYTNAVKTFGYVVTEFAGTEQAARSLYWQGFSYLCLEDNTNAYECFDKYTRDYPKGDQLDEAYYQGGISLFGQDRIEEAKQRFTYIVDEFGTNSVVYPDALNMRGDIEGAEGGDALDAAVADYQEAFRTSTKASQATYATFKLCDIFKADEANLGPRSPELIKQTVNLYLAEWGDEGADISKALFWLGRILIQEKRYEQAATSYLDAIIDYGGDLQQEGVDMMIPELVKMAKNYLNQEQREAVLTRLNNTIELTDNLTLKLRLRVTLAELEDTMLELGKDLIAELPDFEHASPPVLATICEASFAMNDYSRAEELLTIFKNNFDDSTYKRSAFKLRAVGQYEDEDYDGAMATIDDAQAEYGTERDVAWAQLLKAKILYETGRLDEAREEYTNVTGVPAWRGAPFAEAIYMLGQVEEKEGRFLMAHAYYQRAYFQYAGYDDGYWAAEGYLGSARCLSKVGENLTGQEQQKMESNVRNTYRAMLLDSLVNKRSEAEVARNFIGPADVAEIQAIIDSGTKTNIEVHVEAKTAVAGTSSNDTTEAVAGEGDA